MFLGGQGEDVGKRFRIIDVVVCGHGNRGLKLHAVSVIFSPHVIPVGIVFLFAFWTSCHVV